MILCRDVYHCKPSELKGERAVDVLQDIQSVSIESGMRKLETGGT